ncbi:MAG TPA: universal stress protein [Geminicoccaceae bacterium]
MTASDQAAAILHPTDFSRASELAFVIALKVALGLRARLYILHIDRDEPVEIDWAAFPAVRATLERWNLLPPGSPAEAVAAELGVAIRKVDVIGRDPVTAIAEFSDHHPADLIVLATHGRHGPAGWLRGAVAEPVARRARAPTLFLPEGARTLVDPADGEVRLERILVPIDVRPRPEVAVRGALQLARVLGARHASFELLHVGAAADAPTVQIPDDLQGRVEVTQRSGNAIEQILDAASDQRVGLIAMATEGHRGFLDALRGSTTEQVLRRAACPVLAIPTD